MTSASHKAPRFSAAGFRLSQLMALAKQIATAQQQAPAHRKAETAALLTLPLLLALSVCTQQPREVASPTKPKPHYHHERMSLGRWQDFDE